MKISIDDIIDFFGYNEEFWKYAFERTMKVDSNHSDSECFYGVFCKLDSNDRVIDFKIVVPRIIDIKTALVNVHEYKHAYDLYQNFNKVMVDDSIYESAAKREEKRFIKKYLTKNKK